MPTYVYKCPVHGEFEVEQKITEPKLQACPRPLSDLERIRRFKATTGALAWNGGEPCTTHPDRCVCQNEWAPHTHYQDGDHRCARGCGCTCYVPAVKQAACGEPLERLISGGTGFQLKGSGWAKDGYK